MKKGIFIIITSNKNKELSLKPNSLQLTLNLHRYNLLRQFRPP